LSLGRTCQIPYVARFLALPRELCSARTRGSIPAFLAFRCAGPYRRAVAGRPHSTEVQRRLPGFPPAVLFAGNSSTRTRFLSAGRDPNLLIGKFEPDARAGSPDHLTPWNGPGLRLSSSSAFLNSSKRAKVTMQPIMPPV